MDVLRKSDNPSSSDKKLSSKTEKLNQKGQRALKLMLNLEKQRGECFQCDFEVRIDGKRFPVHRSVLAASSNYFNAMLKTDMKEANQGYVEMKGIEVTAVKACLDYLYSGEVEVNFDEIEPILKAADMMQIEDLKAVLFKYITNNISVNNCLQILYYANHYTMACNSQDMRASEKFVAKNFATVSKTEQFKLLDKRQVQQCLKLFKEMSKRDLNDTTPFKAMPKGYFNNLKADLGFTAGSEYITDNKSAFSASSQTSYMVLSTKTQWQAIANWVGFNQEERGGHLLELLKNIEPFDISTVFSDILGDPLIAKTQDCVEFVVKQAVLPNAEYIGKYISVENCFNLNRWAKEYNSDHLKTKVHRFMIENFHTVVISERIGELDFEGIRTFLFDNWTKKFDEKPKYEAIIRWTSACQVERLQYFEELFSLLNITRLPLDFIHRNVRNEPLIKSCPNCNEKIMDALYHLARNPKATSPKYY